MNKVFGFILVGVFLLNTGSVFAEGGESRGNPSNRAVNINLGSSGVALDDAALRAIRKLVGHAISVNTVDTFSVYRPKVGGPIPIEGGLIACAEAGFSSTPQSFTRFVSQLRDIRPKTVVLNVELADRCKPIDADMPLACGGIAGAACPDAKHLRFWSRQMQNSRRAGDVQDQACHLYPGIPPSLWM